MELDYNEKVRQEVEKSIKDRQEVINRRGKKVQVRKQHMTEKQLDKFKALFTEETKDVSKEVKKAAGIYFYNGYRDKGIWRAQIQTLYLLKANEWHSYNVVMKKLAEVASKKIGKNGENIWENFSKKSERQNAVFTRDLIGRIQHNYKQLQRITSLNPYGLRLAQVGSCIDIKRDKDGIYFYRLNTKHWNTEIENIKPVLDSNEYKENKKKMRVRVVPQKKIEKNVVIMKDLNTKTELEKVEEKV